MAIPMAVEWGRLVPLKEKAAYIALNQTEEAVPLVDLIAGKLG
jgi:hypothetical protein